jgi:hypothetical protein
MYSYVDAVLFIISPLCSVPVYSCAVVLVKSALRSVCNIRPHEVVGSSVTSFPKNNSHLGCKIVRLPAWCRSRRVDFPLWVDD